MNADRKLQYFPSKLQNLHVVESFASDNCFGLDHIYKSGAPIDWFLNHAQSIYYPLGYNTLMLNC